MKELLINIFTMLLGISVFCLVFNIKFVSKDDKSNHIEIYTNKDILFIDLIERRVYSESGEIDTIFDNKQDLIEFVGQTTADHVNYLLNN